MRLAYGDNLCEGLQPSVQPGSDDDKHSFR